MRSTLAGLALTMLASVAQAGEGPLTYHRDVKPMLQSKCGGCHRPDGIAPFSLLTWGDARVRAGKIARITLDGLMPPWLPENTGFAHARKLTAADVALLRRWAEAGAPAGDSVSEPNALQRGEWQLGEPDVVLTPTKPFSIPAEGRLQTAHFVFRNPTGTERSLHAVEVAPGNRGVVLHARVLFDRSGRARELAGDASVYERFGSGGFFPVASLTAYEPGVPAEALPADAAMTLAPDTDLIVQIRYRPNGTEQTDVPRLALYFADKAPRRHLSAVFLGNESFRIAPGSDETIIRDQVVLAAPFELRELRPNLLLHGRAIRAWAERPDGKRIPVLEIPEWDLTWQQTYRLATPILLPKGTRIFAEWTIENSSNRELRAGDTPDDESPSLWLGGLVDHWSDHVALLGANLEHLGKITEAGKK